MIHNRKTSSILAAAVVASLGASAMGQTVAFDVPLFGASDIPSRPFFRAPVLLQAGDGSLLAFGEARELIDDPGQGLGVSDIIMKRSTDGGLTWSAVSRLYGNTTNDYTQPTVVLDKTTNDIFLHFEETPNQFISNGTFISTGYGSNTFHHYVMSSSDHGSTWTTPSLITPQVKDVSWQTVAFGPTTGIQLQWQSNPALNGRLVIPAFRGDSTSAANFAAYSDANGATASWTRGADTGPTQTNEVDLVELTDGRLLMNARMDSSGGIRQQFISTDGGATWGSAQPVDLPVTPIDTNMIRYTAKRSGDDRDRLLLSAPLGSPVGQSTGTNYNDRYNIGVWTSYDEGKTWINPRQISSGWGGYTAMQRLTDGSVGIMYESSFSLTDAEMRYANFDTLFLEQQAHQTALTHYDGFGNTIDRKRGGMGWSGSWQGNPTVINNTSLSYSGFKFTTEAGRFDLINGQSVERELATPINMAANSTTYISVLISNQYDTSVNAGNEYLNFSLIDTDGNSQVGFGVGSGEEFAIGGLGDGDGTAQGTAQRSSTYFLVAKLVTQASGFDQIFLKVFESGVDSIPDTDDLLSWTAIGGTQGFRDALIDSILIETGLEVRWSIDELRIGSTFGAVASNLETEVVPEPSSILLLGGMACWPLLRRRCHGRRQG